MMLQKTDVDGFYKDIITGAIINKRDAELATYRSQVSHKKEVDLLQHEIDDVKEVLSDLKKTLATILTKVG